ncbi:MAG: FHA domain-containing protein [Candidatus Polarisedimenticolia bacterium]
MSRKEDQATTTRLDEQMHRPRLKEGIVPEDTRVYVRVMAGPDKGKVFDLSKGGSYVIGRRKGDIPLSDDKVSNRHAEMKILGPEAYFVVDLASTNGTFVNGRRVDRQQLNGGEEIRVGDTLLQLSVIEKSRPVSRF